MKTNYRAAFLLMGLLLAISGFSTKLTPTLMLPVHIVFSAKSYWDGATKSCLPREKGGCCHIWLEGMEPGPGEISGEMVLVKNKIIQLTVSRGKGMNRETWLKYFSDGKFNLDGPLTFDPAVLSRLGADPDCTVPQGAYPVAANGDLLTITFK